MKILFLDLGHYLLNAGPTILFISSFLTVFYSIRLLCNKSKENKIDHYKKAIIALAVSMLLFQLSVCGALVLIALK